MPNQHPPTRFDTLMRIITTPALLVLVSLPLAALWNLTTWTSAGKAAATIILVWFACACIAALITRPRS